MSTYSEAHFALRAFDAMDPQQHVPPQTQEKALQHFIMIYRMVGPLLNLVFSLGVLSPTFRTALTVFRAALDALVATAPPPAAPATAAATSDATTTDPINTDPSFKAGKDL